MPSDARQGLIMGLVLGSALTSAVLVGYAYGQEDAHGGAGYGASPRARAADCQVRVGIGRISGGYECRSNRVMVGTQGNFLLCADLEVDCGD